jgi:hypothetical protein
LKTKLFLLDMAQAWMLLAEQALKNNETTLVYETPPRGPVVIHFIGDKGEAAA